MPPAVNVNIFFLFQVRRELEAIVEFADFSEAKKTWAGYESKIEAQAALEACSQPRLRALQAEFEEEQAAQDEGKYRQYNLLAVCISLKLFML